ncbi:MAG: hypothetical protein JXN61_10890 [Sedimentisphaerales bacterium]|nr:hypothetical protein [Sedimentisphaerales bacterium]
MLRKNDIEQFVRNTLGCTCPDEVFERIDCRAKFALPGGITLDYRINIGGRLLIFVLDIDRFDSVASILPLLVSAGIEDRDNAGFNRFRLVLLAESPDRLSDNAFDLFNSLPTDEKTHLHILAKKDFPTRSG